MKTSRGNHSGAVGDRDATARARDAGTIRPICRAFINFPFDRYLALSVPGVDAQTYRDTFKRLRSDALDLYPRLRLFYAPLRWAKAFETEQFLEVTLDAGTRDERGKLLAGHRLRINWSNWSKAKRTYVRNELEVGRREGMKAHAEKRSIRPAKSS